jgi:hypothetical protein
MFNHKLSIIIASTIMINPMLALADEIAKEPTIATHICTRYLTSRFETESAISPKKEPVVPEGFLAKLKKNLDPELQSISPREAQEIAFAIVSQNSTFDTSIVDSSCLDKLEIIGGAENTKNDIFGKLFDDSISTVIGRAYAALTICHPITNATTLRNRQNTVNYLNGHHQDCLNPINSTLKNIARLEEKSLATWTSKNLIKQDKLNKLYFNSWINIGGLANTNTLCLELFSQKNLYLALGTLDAATTPAAIFCVIHELSKEKNVSYATTVKTISQSILKGLQNPDIPLQHKAFVIGYFGAIEGMLLFGVYTAYLTLQAYAEMNNHLQTGLIATASHIKELKKLSSVIHRNKELLKYLPSLQPLADFNNPRKRSTKLNKLLGMLDTGTFKGKASFFSISGRVLAAYELIKQVKDELAPVFTAAGELDMYVALAKLYKSRDGKEARYCMAEFVKNSSTPIINAHNFWNPFIDPDKVVVNDALFNAASPNSILTGSNTAGKSTIIKALMVNALMAQTFGIAPSESLAITPFTSLNCFMNISDDIGTGASLFDAEVTRAKKLLDFVQSLKKDQFSFVIIDEIFTGTSPAEGEQAALRFAKKIAQYPNSTNIIATHYPKMTALETETNGAYCNFHVEVLRNDDGSLHRTFKLKNGSSFFNVAFDILEERGLFI